MLFNSTGFLIFFPLVVLGYFWIPKKYKSLWLLGASCYFYASWNPVYLLLLLSTAFVSWAGGILIGGAERKQNRFGKKCVLAGCILWNLGVLFFFKYIAFLTGSLVEGLKLFGISVRLPVYDVILPVGISFYTFQALGYLFDVSRKEISEERNFLRYTLFLSFFPQLVAGPIERSKNLMHQIREEHPYDPQRVKSGLLLMGWGYFQKLVIADRIAILVTEVYDHYTEYSGLQIGFATVLFAFQIYCDFGGYSDIAVGAARVLGFSLTKNFNSPYYAVSVSEFWRNWHISLTSWFRDYIYIPLGGNRRGKWKKYRNLLFTFLLSGLWHGAGWNYVVWGLLNGLYQVTGDLTGSFRLWLQKRLRIRRDCFSYRLLQRGLTFGFIDFAWLFFRADSLTAALRMLAYGVANPGLYTFFDPNSVFGIRAVALTEKEFLVLLMSLILLMLVDGWKRKKKDIREMLDRQNIWFRWLVYYGLIFSIVLLGVYGPEYNASTFLYFQF